MSAFMVSKETLDVIVTYCFAPDRYGTVLGYTFGVDEPGALGQLLVELNRAAVNERYRETKAAESYHHHRRDASAVDVYKAVQCLLYQSAEGTCGKTPTYKNLLRLLATIANRIICAMPEYDRATWG